MAKSKASRASKSVRKSRYKTSDYSSSEGEAEVSSSRSTISENERNQIIEDARNAANGSAEISALNLYRKAGRYWDVYPKTDWTYSHHSRDRIEIAPGVVAMPNMSRRSLHNQDFAEHSEKVTDTFSQNEYKPRNLFTNNNYEDREYSISRSSAFIRRSSYYVRVKRVVTSFFTAIFSVFYHAYSYQSNVMLWFGKKVHRVVSKAMLWDTWLLRGDSRNKMRNVAMLCLLPLLLFGGFHALLVNGAPLVPQCHPHCGRIASDYFNSFVESARNAFHVVDYFGPQSN